MAYKRFGVMLDCSRNGVMKMPALKRFVDIIAAMGYNMLQLYTEDTYEIEGEAYFGYLRGGYTTAELKETERYCRERNVEVVPCIQTLAHLGGIFRWNRFRPLSDIDGILLADEEETYALIEKMIATMRECFSSRYINVGMDEAYLLGLGKHLEKHGYEDKGKIFFRHLRRVAEICEKYGFTPLIWSDMLFKAENHGYFCGENEPIVRFSKETLEGVPENAGLIYWYYYLSDKEAYKKMFDSHKQFQNELWFAGGIWTWTGFQPKNGYTERTMGAAMDACREYGIENVLMTLWGDGGKECSYFSVLPALLFVIERANGNADTAAIKAKFKSIVGCEYDDFALLDVADVCAEENSGRYMFYSDPFCGFADKSVGEGEEKIFRRFARRLKAPAREGEFSLLFAFMRDFAKVMEIKYTLGVKTRRIYRENDAAALRRLIGEYGTLARRIERFLETFRALWYAENKPYGFEVQEARIGGLAARIKGCGERLKNYAEKGERIEELERDLLDWGDNEKRWAGPWSAVVTVNTI